MMDALKMYPSPSQNAMAAESGAFFAQSSSQQSQPPPGMSNPEELRLTAQLSRGLGPNMNTGQGGGLPEGQDPRGNVNPYHHDQSQGHAVHMQGSPVQMGQMGDQYGGSPDASNRKRSKVSRACDECRRKKIRCDATEESGDQQCTSCKRVGTRCQFSRVPMKRGPSKGYIKELADRLNTLEGAMQSGEIPVQPYLHPESPLQRRGSDEFSPPPNTNSMQRKRTYSSVSGDLGTQYLSQRPAAPGWTAQEPPRHLPPPSSAFATPSSGPAVTHAFREPNYSPNAFQPAPKWRIAPEPLRRQSSSFESVPGEQSYPDRVADWDESIVDGYYNFIHHTYPLLSQTKNKLSSRLGSCPPQLREAFYESLSAAVRSFPTPGAAPPEQQSSKKAAQLITASQYDNPASRTSATNLIHLQIMLLLAIEADNRDPASTRGQAAPSQSQWLGTAVGLAYSMKLYAYKASSQQPETDPDSDDQLARRIWWSLVIMDRWHNASTSSPSLIPDTTVVLSPDDQALLGESVYQLARISIILGHFTLIPTDLPTPGYPSVLSALARGELERLRESFPPSIFPTSQYPLIHLCYWYLRILLAMRLPESEPQELLDPAMNIVTQLKNNPGLVSPLTHHATALAAGALIALTGYEQIKQEAEGGLGSILESRIAPSGWDASIRTLIINNKNPGPPPGSGGAVSAKTSTSQSQHAAIQGLQRLADLATATEEGTSTSEGRRESAGGQIFQRFHDLRELVRNGYWSKLGGGGDAVR